MGRSILLLVLAASCRPAVGGEKPVEFPWHVNSPIVTVQKTLYRQHPRASAAAWTSMVGRAAGGSRFHQRLLQGRPGLGRQGARVLRYPWTPGGRVETSPNLSAGGLMEPEAAELKDGRVLVIWRGESTPTTPGRKFYSVSTDGGMTLGPVGELRYDDGSSFYSPSSFHRMIRHSVNGKLYWIGNISARPPNGGSPRHPLVIAEVAESGATPALKKNTVTVIDDRQPGQPDAIQFSNLALLEDRETNAMNLYMTLLGAAPDNVFTADSYKYVMTIPRQQDRDQSR